MDLEGFCITMATLLDFSKILFPPDVTGPTLHMRVRFRSEPSRNRDGVRARGHKPYCFYCMIGEKLFSQCSSLLLLDSCEKVLCPKKLSPQLSKIQNEQASSLFFSFFFFWRGGVYWYGSGRV